MKQRRLKFEKTDGGRSKYFKYNKKTPDCVCRAIAIALEKPYLEVWEDLLELAKTSGHLPNEKETYVSYLIQNGWRETKLKRNSTRLNSLELLSDTPTICYINSHLNVLKGDTLFYHWDSRLNSMDKYPYVHRIFRKLN
jgi:hypothetical protein